MKKIISLFQRNYDGDKLVRNELVPGAEWVADGEGVATRKYDGTCCLLEGGKLFKRHDAKKGKTPPTGFVPAQEAPDPVTGHWPGWLLVGEGPEDRWFRAAAITGLLDGTYELCGPHINGNPEKLDVERLIPHGQDILEAPLTFDALKQYLDGSIEGIVWHHVDGRMVKIKAKDFGTRRLP
jgi:hypothetical protein